jgi:hypothetical protein
VDKFLKAHEENPIITVANTIFPQALYEAHGSPAFSNVYHRDFDKLSETKRWGRYFERMTRHQKADGQTYNPLQELIDKMKRQEEAGVRYSSAYELAVYDPLRDGRSLYGGQCLSFLSFKLDEELGLMLTAMYRDHTYITRGRAGANRPATRVRAASEKLVTRQSHRPPVIFPLRSQSLLQPRVGMETHLDRVARSRALSFLGERMPPKGKGVRIIPSQLGEERTQRPRERLKEPGHQGLRPHNPIVGILPNSGRFPEKGVAAQVAAG